ncbi:MAG: hypothetical protein ACFFEE_07040 [Candidatus Thorarchaeota archaeon]
MQVTDIIPTPGPNPILFSLADTLILLILIGAVVYWLHTFKNPHKGLDVSRMRLSPTAITAIMLILAIFGPMAVNIYPNLGPTWIIYLAGMSWQIIGYGIGNVMFSSIFFLIILPFTFFRMVYVYLIYRYFLGLTTRKRAVITGILGEIQFPLFGLSFIPLGLLDPMIAVVFSIPVPTLLIAGLLLMQYIEVPQPIDGWKELDESQDWWDEEMKSVSET